jgi:hypothetical protein
MKFGSEPWALKKRQKQRLETSQMKFLWHVLGISKVDLEVQQYQQEWLQHLTENGQERD